MKYIIELTSEVNGLISHQEKHKKVIDALKLIPKPWGLDDGSYPPPDYGSGITATFCLNKYLAQSIKGDLIYSYRGKLSIKNDDKMFIEFNATKIDYTNLVKNVFKKYVDFFEPYEAEIFNKELIYDDYEKSRSELNFYRFYPIFFWSSEYCFEKIGLAIEDFNRKLIGVVEYSEIFSNGIFVIVTSKVVSLSESNEIDKKLKELVKA